MQIENSLKHFFLPVKPSYSAFKTVFLGMLTLMGLVFVAYFVIGLISIIRISSATAADGFVSLPFLAIVAALKVWLLAFTLAYIYYVFISKSPKCNLYVIICLAFILKNAWFFSHQTIDFVKTKTAIYKINLLHDANEIEKIYSSLQQYPKIQQKFILEAIVLNPFTSSHTLEQIANLNDETLHEKMDSLFFIQPNNREHFAVMRLIARHANASSSTLEKLAMSPSILVVGEVAENSKTPQDIMQRLWEKYGEKIAYNISINSKTPPEILAHLSHMQYPANNPEKASDVERVKANVARNPNTPAIALEELSHDNSVLILQNLIDNPKISPNLLRHLSEHLNEKVKDAAKDKLNKSK
jgi:hypothetical protein